MKKGLIPATILAMLALLATGCGNIGPRTESSEQPTSSQTSSEGGSQGSESGSEGGSQGGSQGSESGSEGGSQSGSQGGSSESTSETTSSSEESSEEVVINYGSLESPLSLADLKTEFAKCTLASGGYTEKQFFVKAKLVADPEAETGSNAGKYAFKLTDGTNELEAAHALLGSFEVWKDDEVTVKTYIKVRTSSEETAGKYPIGFRLTYNPTVTSENEPTVVAKVAAAATLTRDIPTENVTVEGLADSYKNGDTVSFTVTPDTDYAVSEVSLDGTALVATEGVYSFKIHGAMTLKVRVASTVARATSVLVSLPASGDGSDGHVKEGKTVQLTAAVSGDEGVNPSVVWSVKEADAEFASVSETGLVTGLKAGTAEIRATAVAKDADGNDVVGTAVVTIDEKEVVTIASLTTAGIAVDGLVGKVIATNAGKNAYIDDGTACIPVYNASNSIFEGFAAGDYVEVSGTTAVWNNCIQIGSATATKLTSGDITPQAATAVTESDIATIAAQSSFVPSNRVKFTTPLLSTNGAFQFGGENIKISNIWSSYTGCSWATGGIYDLEGYIIYSNENAGTTYLNILLTSSTLKPGKVSVEGSANVVQNESITLTASSAGVTDETYTWSWEAKTIGASVELSSTTGASVTVTGTGIGTVAITVVNNHGYSAVKNVTVAEPGAPEESWVQVTTLDALTSGTYAIVNADYYLPARAFAAKSSGGTAFDIDDTSYDDILWTFTKSAGVYTIAIGDNVLGVNNDNNGVVCSDSKTNTWTITAGTGDNAGKFMLVSSDGTNDRYLTYASGNFRCYKTSGSTGDKYCTIYRLDA